MVDLEKVRFLKIDDMVFGFETKKLFNKSVKEGKDLTFMKMYFKKSYIKLTKALQENLPYKNDTLR